MKSISYGDWMPEDEPFVVDNGIPWRRRNGEKGVREYPPQPPSLVAHGTVWQAEENHDDWIKVGYVPIPRSTLGYALHHYRHGRMMGYPFLDILAFCWEDVKWRRSRRVRRVPVP